MATGNAKRFVEIGVPPRLAREYAAQITAGVGNTRRLIELGEMPGAAKRLAALFSGTAMTNNRLAESGIIPRIIREIKAQIGNTPVGPVTLAVPAPFATRAFAPAPIMRDSSGNYSTTFDSTTLIPSSPTSTVYLDPVNGGTSNTGAFPYNQTIAGGGTQPNTSGPFKNVSQLLTSNRALALGSTQVCYVSSTTDYIWRGSAGWNNVQNTSSLFIINTTPTRRLIVGGTVSAGVVTWTANGSVANVYQSALNTSSTIADTLVAVPIPTTTKLGTAPTNVKIPYGQFKKLAGTDPTTLTPGTFLFDGTNIQMMPFTVKDMTQAANANAIVVGGSVNNLNAGGTTGVITYVDGLEFVGGGITAKLFSNDAAQTPTFVHRNCLFQGSLAIPGGTSSNLLGAQGPFTVYGYRSTAYAGGADNYNYHDFNLNAGGVSTSPKFLEDQCVSFGAGTTGSTQLSDNASTCHEFSTGIRLNGFYPSSDDLTLAEGGGGQTFNWNIGCRVGPATGSTYNASVYGNGVGGAAWNDGCIFDNGTQPAQVSTAATATGGYTVTNGASMFFTNMAIPAFPSGDLGQFASY